MQLRGFFSNEHHNNYVGLSIQCLLFHGFVQRTGGGIMVESLLVQRKEMCGAC